MGLKRKARLFRVRGAVQAWSILLRTCCIFTLTLGIFVILATLIQHSLLGVVTQPTQLASPHSKILVLIATSSVDRVLRFRGTDLAVVWSGGAVNHASIGSDLVFQYVASSPFRFPAISEAYYGSSLPKLFNSYEFIWCVDDRIEYTGAIPYGTLLKNAERGYVGQPAFCQGSDTEWTELVQQKQPTNMKNMVNTVDLAMPIARASWWHAVFPLLRNATTGCGIEFVWTGVSASGGNALVFDDLCMSQPGAGKSAELKESCMRETKINSELFKFDPERKKMAISRVEASTMKNKPDFFIVGFQKTGTSSLWEWIKTSEISRLPHDKENFFFSADPGFVDQKRFNYGYSDLPGIFSNTFGPLGVNTSQITGDATASVVTDVSAIRMIKAWNPAAKIIAILRDPVERSLSRLREQCSLVSRRKRCRKELHSGNLARILQRFENNPEAFADILQHSMYEKFLPQLQHYFPDALILYTEKLAASKSAVEKHLGLKLQGEVPRVNTKKNYGWDEFHIMHTSNHSAAATDSHSRNDILRLCRIFRTTYLAMEDWARQGTIGSLPKEWGKRCKRQLLRDR